MEGEDVEKALGGLSLVDSLQRRDPINGRQRFVLSVSGEGDVRPEIFRIAKQRDWTIWELHEEVARLDDLFHTLTADDDTEEMDVKTAEEIVVPSTEEE